MVTLRSVTDHPQQQTQESATALINYLHEPCGRPCHQCDVLEYITSCTSTSHVVVHVNGFPKSSFATPPNIGKQTNKQHFGRY